METGTLKGIVEDVQHTVSPGKGTYGIKITCRFGDERLAGTIWFSDKAMGFARTQLRSIGFDPDRDLKEVVDLVDTEITVTVGQENYKGVDRYKIERFGSDEASDEIIAKAQEAIRAIGKGKSAEEVDEPTFH
ncbi:MAG: hypothetical protein WC551_10540 [Patescibacteria group bacterium]